MLIVLVGQNLQARVGGVGGGGRGGGDATFLKLAPHDPKVRGEV
jgi:hypothetical protein